MSANVLRFPKKPKWWMIAILVIVIVLVTLYIQTNSADIMLQEGATGSQTTKNAVAGNVYTMVNTVTEPDGTVVTDTLDTEGNYVTTVYTSNTMNANQITSNPSPSNDTQQHSYTEIKQPRVTFQE